LLVSGTVEIAIEYGARQSWGPSIVDPQALSIVRVADGRLEFLSTDLNDTAADVITALYMANATIPGSDQFGEFALVEQIPEPSSAMLLAIGMLGFSVLPLVSRRPAGPSLAAVWHVDGRVELGGAAPPPGTGASSAARPAARGRDG
jgi:hypothetical protein